MIPVLAFMDLGFQEIFLILVVALVLYGGRLPEVARSVGRTVGEFKRQAQKMTREFQLDDYDPPRPPPPFPSIDSARRRLKAIPAKDADAVPRSAGDAPPEPPPASDDRQEPAGEVLPAPAPPPEPDGGQPGSKS